MLDSLSQHIRSSGIRLWACLFLLLTSTPLVAQLRINEVLSLNASAVYDPDFGMFSDFVEIYNAGGSAINLQGYSISDNENNRRKWVFPVVVLPAGQYLVLWADGKDKNKGDTAWCFIRNITITTSAFHLNFRLSGEGEYLGLFDPGENTIDELITGKQLYDVSYGRNPASPDQWLWYGDVTPGKANPAEGAVLPVFASEPEFSLPGGFYQSTQFVTISSPVPDGVVRFTFDGSEPGASSPVFTEPFQVIRTYTLKARIYQPGRIPGPVVTRTYFINQNINLPVVSLSTDYENLWDHDFGLFKNSLKEREIPAVIEYFDTSGNCEFVQGAGIRLFGATIYNLPQKPMSVRFRPRYGTDMIEYPVFSDRENNRYRSLFLRNGGNDYNIAFMRDALATLMAAGRMDIDYQAYRPCVVFINGEYQGIYDIRERLDVNYTGFNHDVNPEELDILADSLVVESGSSREYEQMLHYIAGNDLSEHEHYQHISSQMDVNEYINYMIHKIFIGYSLVNLNNKYWRERNDEGHWRWIAHDMEHAFGQLGGDQYWENTLASVSGNSGSVPLWSVFLFQNLLKNNAFRDMFIQRFAWYTSTLYKPEATTQLADSLQAALADQMPRHIAKWGTPASVSLWNSNIQFIKDFLSERPAHIRQHIASQFGIADSAFLTIHVQGKGNILLNGVLVADTVISGHFFREAKIFLQAVPFPGHRFVEWQGTSLTDESLELVLSGDSTLTALFEPAGGSIVPAEIYSDTVLQAALSPWYAPGDVVVHPGATLAVEAGVELLMADKASLYVKGTLLISGNESDSVVVRPAPSPALRKPYYNPRPRWGVICLDGAEDTARISYTSFTGSGYGKNRNRQFATITALNSNIRMNHVSISNTIQPFYSEYGQVYIGHSRLRSDVTCDLINVKYAGKAIVEHCDLRGNLAPDTDGIDYDGVEEGIIRYNRIYGFHAPNSDGIDLGENALNVLIENNIIFDCCDKGISVGQGSLATVMRNLIFNCDMGVAVKDSFSYALIDQNTFHANNHAVAVYEKNAGRGGGAVLVMNTILSNAHISPVFVDELSLAEIRYSISDTRFIPGEGNIFGDPGFVNPARGNYELLPGSPCIDAGDPESDPDPDLSRADIGARYTHQQTFQQPVRINEICYHSPFNYQAGDWIEVYNEGDTAVNLKGWHLKDQINSWLIRDNLVLLPGAYYVLCQDSSLFGQIYPEVRNVSGNFGFDLSNRAGQVRIMDAGNNPVHAVNYADRDPWPSLPDGRGATLELLAGRQGNGPEDWQESYVLMGTPAVENSYPPDIQGLYLNELMAVNNNTIADEFGEYDDWFEVYNSGDSPVNIGGLYFTDKPLEPCRWQVNLNFPEMTTIPPKGFLLLWADGQTEQGPLHAGFSLSSQGEDLVIFQKRPGVFQVIDYISFGQQVSISSYGRFPDGGQEWSFLHPTPGQPNMITTIPVTFLPEVMVAPNPFSGSTRFRIQGSATPFDLLIYDISGKPVMAFKEVHDNDLVVDFPGLASGIYFYRLVTADGKIFSGKLVLFQAY